MLGTVFAFSFVSCDGDQIVVLERYLERRCNEVIFQVIDQLALPMLENGRSILEVVSCESPVHKNDPVFGIGVWKDQEDGSIAAEQISHAWRFDLQHGKIETIAPNELICTGEYAD